MEAGRLKFYFSNSDKFGNKLLYDYIVNFAHDNGIAGATVAKGILGFGSSSVLHSYRLWEISDKTPVIIEIVDDLEKLNAFFGEIKPVLESINKGILVTLEPTNILYQSAGKQKK
jgi:PII-like signaling protein